MASATAVHNSLGLLLLLLAVPTVPGNRAIAGIAVASVLVFVFLLISVALCVVIFVLARRQKKTHPELTWPGSTAQGIRVFIKSFDPSKWLGYLAADSPEGEELDKFVAGWEDNDVEKSSVAVMVLNCENDGSISVEPMQCPQATDLLTQLQRRRCRTRGAKTYVRLYPEKLPPD